MKEKVKKILVIFLIVLAVLIIGSPLGILYMKDNVLDYICKWKIESFFLYDLYQVEEAYMTSDDEGVWYDALDFFRWASIYYKEKYLQQDVNELKIRFYSHSDAISIITDICLSEAESADMILYIFYDTADRVMEYQSVYIVMEDKETEELIYFYDEENVMTYLEKYNVTKEDIAEWQRYALYDVVVKTWVKAHHRPYWLEKWKLERLPVVDNTFQFEEEN